MTPSVLVFGYGNPSRGDDALGPAFIERIEALRAAHPDWPQVELLTDFQINVEHALDMQNRHCVLLVDASATADAPFSCQRIFPSREIAYTTHVMLPQSLLYVYQRVTGVAPPPSFLLGIRGEHFELGQPLSQAAVRNLRDAVTFTVDLLTKAAPKPWEVPHHA
jgi:hydrogenase maturation protease